MHICPNISMRMDACFKKKESLDKKKDRKKERKKKRKKERKRNQRKQENKKKTKKGKRWFEKNDITNKQHFEWIKGKSYFHFFCLSDYFPSFPPFSISSLSLSLSFNPNQDVSFIASSFIKSSLYLHHVCLFRYSFFSFISLSCLIQSFQTFVFVSIFCIYPDE